MTGTGRPRTGVAQVSGTGTQVTGIGTPGVGSGAGAGSSGQVQGYRIQLHDTSGVLLQ